MFYSVLRDVTTSCLLAICAGIEPPISVNTILIAIKIIAWIGFKTATLDKFVKFLSSTFIGIISKLAIPIPSKPDAKPIITVSALNTLLISFFLHLNFLIYLFL